MTIIWKDKLVEKWERTGFLKHLHEDLKVRTSFALENAQQYHRVHHKTMGEMSKNIYPAIRIWVGYGFFVENDEQIDAMVKAFDQFLIDEEEKIDAVVYYTGLDKEVEVLTMFCDMYLIETGTFKDAKELYDFDVKRDIKI